MALTSALVLQTTAVNPALPHRVKPGRGGVASHTMTAKALPSQGHGIFSFKTQNKTKTVRLITCLVFEN